jgi:cytochrome oxidase Cu insertion factor (SCO1/SenC/PrrC family)
MKLLFTCFISLLCLTALAQPNKKAAAKGGKYGAATTAVGAIEVNLLEEKLITAESFKGKVKGCWMKLAQTEGDGIMIRFKDYKFFMPLNIVGKDVVLQGEAKKTVTSVEMLKHYAEDAGKSKEEIEKITEPKTEIEFIATGVLVVS